MIENGNKQKIKITELPIYTWNDKYYEFLDKLIEDKFIKDYDKYCTDSDINIVVSIPEEILETMSDEMIYKKFNLETYINMNNMNLFDENNKKELFDPLEDDVVVFDGLHCANPPKYKPRIVLVATYI